MRFRFLKILVAGASGLAFLSAVTAHALLGSALLGSSGSSSPPPPPSNIACDFGPNTTLPTGTAGTDITTAGFTHCMLNADFSDNSGATVGGGWVMNNLNTYVNASGGGCTNSSGNAFSFNLYWAGAGSANNDLSQAPCSKLSFTTDGGVRVLTFSMLVSDNNGTNVAVGFSFPKCFDPCGGTTGSGLPVLHYVEWTYRITSLTQNTSNIFNTLEDTIPNNASPQNGWLDEIPLEGIANNQPSYGEWDDYTTVNTLCPSFKCTSGRRDVPDLGNYHTQAILTTADGTTGDTHAAGCYYRDNSLASQTPDYSGAPTVQFDNCVPIVGWDVTRLNDHVNSALISAGGASSPAFDHNITINIKSIRIFTCSNPYGANNNCTGTLVNHR